MQNSEHIELIKSQNALISSLLDRVAALEFAVLTLAVTHPHPKKLAEEVQSLIRQVNTPPDPEWEAIAKQIERLVMPPGPEDQPNG